MTFVSERYNVALRWAIRRRMITVGVCLLLVAFANYLAFSGVIGSEFLPHLDEGALWVRGTLAPSTGPDEGIRVANQARIVLCSFPRFRNAQVRWGGQTTGRITPASLTPNILWT